MERFYERVVKPVGFWKRGNVVFLAKNDVEVFFDIVAKIFFVGFCRNGLSSICNFENFIDVGEVRFDGIRRNIQSPTNFVIGESLA